MPMRGDPSARRAPSAAARLDRVVKPIADSVDLAHAIVARADVFLTVDGDDLPIGEAVDGVRVEKPHVFGNSELFTQKPD